MRFILIVFCAVFFLSCSDELWENELALLHKERSDLINSFSDFPCSDPADWDAEEVAYTDRIVCGKYIPYYKPEFSRDEIRILLGENFSRIIQHYHEGGRSFPAIKCTGRPKPEVNCEDGKVVLVDSPWPFQ